MRWDTSEQAWLEGCGPKLYLIGMIDDATSRCWRALPLGREHDKTGFPVPRAAEKLGRQSPRDWKRITRKYTSSEVDRMREVQETLWHRMAKKKCATIQRWRRETYYDSNQAAFRHQTLKQ